MNGSPPKTCIFHLFPHDSNGWEREEDQVRNVFDIQADAEDELELANFTFDGPVNNHVLDGTGNDGP